VNSDYSEGMPQQRTYLGVRARIILAHFWIGNLATSNLGKFLGLEGLTKLLLLLLIWTAGLAIWPGAARTTFSDD
jgi:hypothetical protein